MHFTSLFAGLALAVTVLALPTGDVVDSGLLVRDPQRFEKVTVEQRDMIEERAPKHKHRTAEEERKHHAHKVEEEKKRHHKAMEEDRKHHAHKVAHKKSEAAVASA